MAKPHTDAIERIRRADAILRSQILRKLPGTRQAEILATCAEGYYYEQEDKRTGVKRIYAEPPNMDALKLAIERTAGKVATPVEVSGQVNHLVTLNTIIVPHKKPVELGPKEVGKAEVVEDRPALLLPQEDELAQVQVGKNNREKVSDESSR